nr:hypothetical protein [Brachyspira sp. G79]
MLDRNKRTPSTIKYEVREALRKKFMQIIGREPVIFVCLYMDHVYIENTETSENDINIDNIDNFNNEKIITENKEEIKCHTKKKKRIKKTAAKKKTAQIKRTKSKKKKAVKES